jgi:hypothetical protein
MVDALLEVELVPLHGAQFGDAQAVAVGRQDHGGVPVAVAVAAFGRLDEFGHFGGGQEFPRAALAVGDPARGRVADDCPIFKGWGLGHRGRFLVMECGGGSVPLSHLEL